MIFHTALIRHAQEQGKGAFTNFLPPVTKNISRLVYPNFSPFTFHDFYAHQRLKKANRVAKERGQRMERTGLA